MLMRALYTLIMYLATPIIIYRLAARGLRYREYFSRWRERFGFFVAEPNLRDTIWVHAVSVGEVNAAVPLIEALMKRHRDRRFVLTTVTPTGSERVKRLFGHRVFHVYLPYDLPASIERFLTRINPSIALIMETEIWPNLYFACDKRKIPIVIANARLSERSLKGYKPVWAIVRDAVRCVTFIAAQSQLDAERLLKLGAIPERLAVTGNVKFDMPVPQGLETASTMIREYCGRNRPVWIAASTHEAEEEAVIEAHVRVLRRYPDALLLIAPRHPERFKPVAQLCRNFGFRTLIRSDDSVPLLNTQCFVIDTLGELLMFYAASDVAFVAGSFAPIGGHNVLEPAALQRAVIFGPQVFNFAEACEGLLADGAALQVENAAALGEALVQLLADENKRRVMGRKALDAVEKKRGAVARAVNTIDAVLDGKSAAEILNEGTAPKLNTNA